MKTTKGAQPAPPAHREVGDRVEAYSVRDGQARVDGVVVPAAHELHLENVRLADENRQLRRWLTSLLWWIGEREELLEFARTQIDRRWPEKRRRRA